MNEPRTLIEADLPIHPDPHAWTWTELEKRAILRWGQELLDAMNLVLSNEEITEQGDA